MDDLLKRAQNTVQISIIIPTLGREKILCNTIDSVLKEVQRCALRTEQYELIIVDQTPKHVKSTEDFLRKYSEEGLIKYIFEQRTNLPNARNVGIRKSNGTIVLFLDDDVILHENFLKILLQTYQNGDYMSVVGLPYLKNLEGENILLDNQSSIKKLLRTIITRIFCGKKASVITNFGVQLSNREHSKSAFADAGKGCCMSFRKVVFDKIGYFDTNYIGNALREETDLFFRMKKNNMIVYFNPNVALDHIMANTGGCRNEQNELYWKTFFDNQIYFFRKNYHFRKWWIICLLMFDILKLKRNGFSIMQFINRSYNRSFILLKV
jgi:glycosyltransferase involved in cell wall biosynthesis